MNINWKIRFKNKVFWLTIIPVLFLLVQQIAKILGIELDLSNYLQQILDIVNTIFVLLAILGVVTDQTTEGLSDSDSAIGYDELGGK